MKKILIPVDFSVGSENALKHAIQMAQIFDAELFVLHVFHIPIPSTDLPYMNVSFEEEEETLKARMDELLEKMKTQTGYKKEINSIIEVNYTIEGIINKSREIESDLIMMGQRGNTTFADRLFGSTATAMINQATCPVLLIPEKAPWKTVERIAIACDLSKRNDDIKVKCARQFAEKMKSKLLLFTVLNDDKEYTPEKADNTDYLEEILRDYPHGFYYPYNDDIHEGILSFVKNHDTQILTMFPHRHNIIEQLFTKINSGKISQQIDVPLLLIGDKTLL